MRRNLKIWICILISIGVGWYLGFLTSVARKERNRDQHIQSQLHELDSDISDLNTRRVEYFNAAKPYEASGASIALGALKDLNANDTNGARVRLAAMVAIYYRDHLHDGDTNLLKSIVDFTGADAVLSNAVYRKFP
jgi:hypothetical protein